MLGGREGCGLRKISVERRLSHVLRGEFSSPKGKEGGPRGQFVGFQLLKSNYFQGEKQDQWGNCYKAESTGTCRHRLSLACHFLLQAYVSPGPPPPEHLIDGDCIMIVSHGQHRPVTLAVYSNSASLQETVTLIKWNFLIRFKYNKISRHVSISSIYNAGDMLSALFFKKCNS